MAYVAPSTRTPGLKARSKALAEARKAQEANEAAVKAVKARAAMRAVAGK